MKEIILTQGKVALVDDEDFEYFNQWKWYARKDANNFYAQRNGYKENGKRGAIHMHREILGLTNRHILCDHRDHNGLNNQRYNLRVTSYSGNAINTLSSRKSTSIFLGVSWHKKNKKWIATISKNKVPKYLGSFHCEIEAAKTYDKHALEIHGEFANLNFNGL